VGPLPYKIAVDHRDGAWAAQASSPGEGGGGQARGLRVYVIEIPTVEHGRVRFI